MHSGAPRLPAGASVTPASQDAWWRLNGDQQVVEVVHAGSFAPPQAGTALSALVGSAPHGASANAGEPPRWQAHYAGTAVDVTVVSIPGGALVRLSATSVTRAAEAFGALGDLLDQGVFFLSPSLRIGKANAAGARMFATTSEELLGRDARSLFVVRPRDDDPSLTAVLDGRLVQDDALLERSTGERFAARLQAVRLRDGWVCCLVQDLARESTPQRAYRTRRIMEAVTRMSNQVSHETNNLLTVILSMTELMLDEDHLPVAERRECLQSIAQACQRIASRTDQLARFSDSSLVNPVVLDLNHLVGELAIELRSLFPLRGQLTLFLEPNAQWVEVEASALTHALVEVVRNAAEAIGDRGQVSVDVSSRSAANEVVVAVTDDGPGMAPEVFDRALEPFYSVRSQPGLGLSIAYGVLEQHGGTLEIDSEPGAGTTVRLRIPALRLAAQALGGTPPAVQCAVEDPDLQALVRALLGPLIDGDELRQAGAGEPGSVLIADTAGLVALGHSPAVPTMLLGHHDVERSQLRALPDRSRFLVPPFPVGAFTTALRALL